MLARLIRQPNRDLGFPFRHIRLDGFGARYESYLTDPADEPDMAKWETEVAIRLAD